jgi:hypothetical protein
MQCINNKEIITIFIKLVILCLIVTNAVYSRIKNLNGETQVKI